MAPAAAETTGSRVQKNVLNAIDALSPIKTDQVSSLPPRNAITLTMRAEPNAARDFALTAKLHRVDPPPGSSSCCTRTAQARAAGSRRIALKAGGARTMSSKKLGGPQPCRGFAQG